MTSRLQAPLPQEGLILILPFPRETALTTKLWASLSSLVGRRREEVWIPSTLSRLLYGTSAKFTGSEGEKVKGCI